VPDDEDRLILVVGEARDHRVIVGKTPVTVNLDEVGAQPVDVVEGVGSQRVARHLHPLPRREVPVDLFPDLLDAASQLLDLAVALLGARHQRQRVDLLLQYRDRFFEFERVARHGSLC
jgi:hypothetical protein